MHSTTRHIIVFTLATFLWSICSPLLWAENLSVNQEVLELLEVEEESKTDTEEETTSMDQDIDALAYQFSSSFFIVSLLESKPQSFVKNNILRKIDQPPQR